MSTLHLDVMLSELKNRFEVEVDTKEPRIPYLETITVSAQARYRHKKQTGGRGQFGEVYIRLEPMERGGGFEFHDEIVGGVIPGQYIPAVEKGIKAVMEEGVIAGYPFVDVSVHLYDGSYHSVDSSEAAFKMAGGRAFKEAVQQAKPVLLEPMVKIEVTAPGQFMGDLTGDINSRRGRILGMDTMGDMQIIRAVLPQSEAANYATNLRSMTGGNASYTLEFSHYDPVPAKVQQDIVAAHAKEEEE
jgi:elongation factor G